MIYYQGMIEWTPHIPYAPKELLRILCFAKRLVLAAAEHSITAAFHLDIYLTCISLIPQCLAARTQPVLDARLSQSQHAARCATHLASQPRR